MIKHNHIFWRLYYGLTKKNDKCYLKMLYIIYFYKNEI